MRNALWRSGRADGKGHISLNAVSPKDGSTPLDAGHSSIADTLVFLTQRTAQDLVLLPYGDYDRQSMSHDVPERGVYSGGWPRLAVVGSGWLGVLGGVGVVCRASRVGSRQQQLCVAD
jgi:hypothetical protein